MFKKIIKIKHETILIIGYFYDFWTLLIKKKQTQELTFNGLFN